MRLNYKITQFLSFTIGAYHQMKLTFFIWSLLSKNRFLISLVKKIISPLWSHKYNKDRSKEVQRYLSDNNFLNLQTPTSDIFQVVIIITDSTSEQALRGASNFFSHCFC